MTQSKYEGAFAENPPPGYHVISRLEPWRAEILTVDVIKIPVLEPRGRELVCAYEILVQDMDDKEAIALIIDVILGDLTDHYFRAAVDTIAFENIRSSVRQTLPYPP